jgi:hypothetical protein
VIRIYAKKRVSSQQSKGILNYFKIRNQFFYCLGEHHYFDIHKAYGPGSKAQIYSERDEKKRQLCEEKGINFVCIPYWYENAYLHINRSIIRFNYTIINN